MAIQATAVWEIRSDGSNTNGGAFDAGIASAGTDYSQQAAAQLSLTDCECQADTSIVSSATAGFTTEMIGNAIYLSGANDWINGWYFITARIAAGVITVDRVPVTADATAGVGKVGGALASVTDAAFESFVAGNKCWIKNVGSVTNTGISISVGVGTAALPIVVEGYQTTRGDNPKGANRPTIASGANGTAFGTYTIVKNLIHTTTSANGMQAPTGGNVTFINCKSTNTSATANRNAFNLPDSQCYECEGVSDAGEAFEGATAFQCFGCYAHDSVGGFNPTGPGSIIGCVADTCSGYGISTAQRMTIAFNTIYNCGNGIETGASDNLIIANNIIHTCTNGITSATVNGAEFQDNNSFYACTNNTVNMVDEGEYGITANPLLNDPANKDFTLQAGSPAIDAGMEILNNIGLTGTY